MGGNLYKVNRVNRARYDEIVNSLLPVLDKHFGDHYRIPIAYHHKPDFGDVDIILDAGFLQDKDWLSPVLADLGSPFHKQIRNVVSLNYMNFQVDFFVAPTTRFHSTYNFMCYNILGNLIGRLYHKFNLKYGEQGLEYVLRGYNNHISKEIIVSRDMRTMLEFVDLSYERWLMGFDSLKDIFDYVIDSKYFCSKSYNLDFFNVKKRKFERPDFNTLLDYIHDNKIEKNYSFDPDKDKYLPMIDEYFKTNLTEKYQHHIDLSARLKVVAEKFNGRIVGELIPELKQKELGSFINEFRSLYGVDYLYDATPKLIESEILSVYRNIFLKEYCNE